MDVLNERVAGLDVHQATIVACVHRMNGVKVRRRCRSFATTTAGLLDLLACLSARRCSHVAMEAAGVYWKSVWNTSRDGHFVLIVANAAYINNVLGGKTDMNDAMWIADLVACGPLRAGFVPAGSLQELRSLMHTRKQVSREETRHVQRNESAGKRKPVRLRHGSPWPKTMLV
jgi:transposase